MCGRRRGSNGFLLEDFPCPPRGFLLGGGKIVEIFPKLFGRLEAVVHLRRRGGFAPLRTVSMSANRPASASAMPCLNSLGIHESSCSTTNLVTCARSAGGKALNSLMTSCALIAVTIHKNSSLTSCELPDAKPQREVLQFSLRHPPSSACICFRRDKSDSSAPSRISARPVALNSPWPPPQSGAKATRTQNASRLPGVLEPREASGVRACSAPLSPIHLDSV